MNTPSVKRRLFNLGAAGSLVLCVAALVWPGPIVLPLFVPGTPGQYFRFQQFALAVVDGPNYDYWTVIVPTWFAMMLFALLPILWLRADIIQAKQIKRLRSGACLHCGYDLRATPERCPECGTAVPPAQPQPQKAGNA